MRQRRAIPSPIASISRRIGVDEQIVTLETSAGRSMAGLARIPS
jgi:hypothetical protein